MTESGEVETKQAGICRPSCIRGNLFLSNPRCQLFIHVFLLLETTHFSTRVDAVTAVKDLGVFIPYMLLLVNVVISCTLKTRQYVTFQYFKGKVRIR